MKKSIALVLCILMLAALLPAVQPHFAQADERYLEIDETNFPDDNFRAWIIDNLTVSCDAETGYYMTGEHAATVVTINCSDQNIASLAGIEHFTALDFLDCSNNQLTALDIGNNTDLTYLGCNDNRLTELDVSRNTGLTVLICGGNQLTALDVSKNTALQHLYCNNNQLTALDVSKNTGLLGLDCDHNQLTALDVSKNTALMQFSADGQTVLDQEGDRTNGAYTFDMKKLMSTQQLQNVSFLPDSGITMNSTGIVTLPGRVDSFSYQYNAAVDPSGTPIELPELPTSAGAMTRDAAVRMMEVTVSLTFPTPQGRYLEINETNFPDANFLSWIIDNLAVSGNGASGYYMTETQVNAVTDIDCSETGISSLVGVEHFTSLEVLDCYNNNLSTLDVSNNHKLNRLRCYQNNLTQLDVSANTELEKLRCQENNLTSLDVSKNTKLQMLDCYDNRLESLDVSANTVLQRLFCENNHLRTLNVSKNTALAYFSADGQTALDQEGDRTNGAYTFDMKKLMSTQQFQNVSFLPDSGITMNSTGIVTLPGRVDSFSYQYNAAVDPSGTPIELPEIPASVGAVTRNAETRMMDVTVYLRFEALPAFDGTIEWNADDVQFNGTTPYVFANGSAQTPRIKLRDASGSVIDPSHYTCEYRDNINAGTAYVIVTFLDTYEGTIETWFMIYPQSEILTHPKSQTVANGKAAKFTVAAMAKGVKYQWYYSTNNGTSWKIMSGKTSASVSVTASATTNGYLYRCEVTKGGDSSTSKSAKLTVSGVKPKITQQPKKTTVTVGETATFKLVAAGTGLKYQWYYSKDNGAKWTKWSGKTSASVTVTSSEKNNGTLYRCVVSNTKGSVTSKTVQMTVSGVKPRIMTQPKKTTVASGKYATFTVAAAGVGLTYQWYYSKDNGANWTLYSGKTSDSVKIKASASNNGNLYRCEITNEYGTVTTSAVQMTVSNVKPRILTQPADAEAKSGKTAKFTVAAAGSGLKYQWQYSKNKGKTWTNLSGKTSATLSVTVSKTNNGYLYRCIVKNTKGSVTSTAAKLTMQK